MSNNFINNNNNNNNNNNGRRRNFQGSLPSTNYQMPQNFAQKDMEFSKAPSFSQFKPSNSGIKRDWSGSEMKLPEFKGLNKVGNIGKSMYKTKQDKLEADEDRKKPLNVFVVNGTNSSNTNYNGAEDEDDNAAPRTRPDGSPITPFPKDFDFGSDNSQDSGSPTKKKGATSYDENGELMMDLESDWTARDTGRAAKEVGKLAGRKAKEVGAKVFQRGKERFSKGAGKSSQFDAPDFDDPFA